MRQKTNKKRGDRYMGRGHSRSDAGSKGGVGRAGYKKHKKDRERSLPFLPFRHVLPLHEML